MATSAKSREFEFIQGLTTELSSDELIFPTSLKATMRIRSALNNADSSVEIIARIIGSEPVLSAQILRLCNSAMFNRDNQQTSDLRKATVRLGVDRVRKVAIWVGMKQLTESSPNGAMPQFIDGLWKRTIRIAALSFVIARKLTCLNPDSAMMAGLLHDIGKFYILNQALNYAELFNSERALWEVVDQWHQNIGVSILESWNVADEIRLAVLDHRDVQRKHKGHPDLADVVAAADVLDAHFNSTNAQQIDWNSRPRVLAVLNMGQQNCEMLMADAMEKLALIFQTIP